MGNHSRTPESTRTASRYSPRQRMRRGAMSSVTGAQSSEIVTLGERDDAAYWAGMVSLNAEIRASREKSRNLKRTFEQGLRSLVGRKIFHPQVLNCLPDLHMIRLMDEVDEGNFGPATEAYMQPGRQSLDIRETVGRYLAVPNLEDKAAAMHELTHVGVRLGVRGKYHVLREPITNQFARGIMIAQDEDASKLNDYYRTHEGLLSQVMESAQLSWWDISYFVSGDDPVENDMLLRRTVEDRVGWDMVGFMQDAYLSAMYAKWNPQHDHYYAAQYTQQVLDAQIVSMQQPQVA